MSDTNARFDPRRALESLLNTLEGKDPTLWQILRWLQQLTNDNKDQITAIENLTSVITYIEVPVPTVGSDISVGWPIVTLPVDRSGNTVFKTLYAAKIVLSAKDVPTGSSAVFDLLYSSDSGATFFTLFQGISFELPEGIQMISYANMTTKTFKEGTIFRLDCSVVAGTTGIEVKIMGVPQL